ncbi:MAG: hypothetical protein NTW05_20050 [Pseudonocardiales bacterium]|nr:hypothetical protein [Pseudonocardiales bacterium]
MTMWLVGAAAVWSVGACATALVLGAVLRRGAATDAGADLGADPGVDAGAVASGAEDAAPVVTVPAQRGASPATPPYGMRSQAHLSCAGTRPAR